MDGQRLNAEYVMEVIPPGEAFDVLWPGERARHACCDRLEEPCARAIAAIVVGSEVLGIAWLLGWI